MKKVVKWVKNEELLEKEKKELYIGGNFSVDKYKKIEPDEYYEDAIIRELIDNNYIICGDTHQELCIPIFENNEYIELPMRKWGEIMAQVENLRTRKYNYYTYEDFYLTSLCGQQQRLPKT